jgi:hypothetical protein
MLLQQWQINLVNKELQTYTITQIDNGKKYYLGCGVKKFTYTTSPNNSDWVISYVNQGFWLAHLH